LEGIVRTWALAVFAVGLALPSGAWAAGLLEKEHPRVRQGRQAYSSGRHEAALESFNEARKELPDNPKVEFNRGDALMKLGRHDEARESFSRVAESKDPALRQKATYNLGNVHARQGNTTEALKAYRQALMLDPSDAQARHNYEVLLKNIPPPKQKQEGADGGTDGGTDGGQDGGSPDAGADGGMDGGQDGGVDGGQDGGSDAGHDGGQGDGGQPDAGQDGGTDGGQGDGGQGDGGQGDGGQGDGGQDEDDDPRGDGGTEVEHGRAGDAGFEPVDIDRQEAERLLDAMKQNEKNLQLWRFQKKKQSRRADEKDW
jgi:tetratricopeptide (TPR) repeat protein